MNLYQQEISETITTDKIFTEGKLNNKTILLSGATGSVGQCLIDMIEAHNNLPTTNADEKIKVIGLSRHPKKSGTPNVVYEQADVNEPIPDFGSVDYVIHAASNTHPAQYAKEPINTLLAGVLGTKNMLDYAVNNKAKRFCLLSSVEIYGENRGDKEAFDEDYLGYINCNTTRASYPEGKRAGEALCNGYLAEYEMDFVIARLSRLYGTTMLKSDSKVVASLLKDAKAGRQIELKSDGLQQFSYTFITDAVRGILYSLLYGKTGEAYNISDKKSVVTLRYIANHIATKNGGQVIYSIPSGSEAAGFSGARKSIMDSKKLESIGWETHVDMEKGLDHLLDIGWPKEM